jgi:hypothetical protein
LPIGAENQVPQTVASRKRAPSLQGRIYGVFAEMISETIKATSHLVFLYLNQKRVDKADGRNVEKKEKLSHIIAHEPYPHGCLGL